MSLGIGNANTNAIITAGRDFTKGMSMTTIDPVQVALATTNFYMSWNRDGSNIGVSASQHPVSPTSLNTNWFANGYDLVNAPGVPTGRKCLSRYYNRDFLINSKETNVTHDMFINGLSTDQLDCHGSQIATGEMHGLLSYRIACKSTRHYICLLLAS